MNPVKAKFFFKTTLKLFKHPLQPLNNFQKLTILQKSYYFTSKSTVK